MDQELGKGQVQTTGCQHWDLRAEYRPKECSMGVLEVTSRTPRVMFGAVPSLRLLIMGFLLLLLPLPGELRGKPSAKSGVVARFPGC